MVAIKRHIQIDKRMRSSSRLKCSSNNFCSSASEVRKAMWSAFRALTSFAGILDFRKHPFDLAPCPSFRYPKDFDRAKYNNWLKLSGITGRQRIEDVLVNIEALRRENIPEYPTSTAHVPHKSRTSLRTPSRTKTKIVRGATGGCRDRA